MKEENVIAYASRVFEYVDKIHGEPGLIELRDNPDEAFKKYAKEYNEKFEAFKDKILLMPALQGHTEAKECMQMMCRIIYNKINKKYETI
jgi:hypothetical protein